MTSHPEYGIHTTATEVVKALSKEIQDKIVLVTGVSPLSLGETTAVSIASAAPSLLILASRTPPKLSAVVHQIASTYPSVPTKSVIIDLSSQASIRSAAASIQKLTPKIDVLINNAGVMMPERHFTADGIEMLFGTNYVGSFLLTNLLMPQLRASAKQSSRPGSTRVVNLTSAGHRISPIRFSDYNFDRMPDELPEDEKPAAGLPKSFFRDGEAYTGFLAYGQSKTGNVLFSMTLTERLGAEGILSFSVHPGSIVTDLSRHLDAELTNVIESTGGYWKTHDEGATTTLVAAFDPALTKESGHYLADCQIAEPAPHASDKNVGDRLWRLSEDLVGENFDLEQG